MDLLILFDFNVESDIILFTQTILEMIFLETREKLRQQSLIKDAFEHRVGLTLVTRLSDQTECWTDLNCWMELDLWYDLVRI